ncbi:MAG: hypothetical protein AB8F74_21620, partial [Saprospiraceae bacterium]
MIWRSDFLKGDKVDWVDWVDEVDKVFLNSRKKGKPHLPYPPHLLIHLEFQISLLKTSNGGVFKIPRLFVTPISTVKMVI